MEQPAATSTASAAAMAAEALRCTQDEPARARALAQAVLDDPRVDLACRSMAQEALGLAAKELHDLGEAVTALRAAVRSAEHGPARARAAQARMSLAFVLQSCGEPLAALEQVDRAARDLQGHDAARAQMRRGSILQRLGRLDDALEAYQHALPGLRAAGDQLWEARLLSNRGVILTSQAAFGAAERDLLRAAALHDALGQRLAAAQTRHNLGFLAARRGDVPVALAWFDRADQAHRELGVVDWVGMADRCELLLASRLLDEARELAEQAVRALGASGSTSDLAEARLVLAGSALLQGDVATARAAAELAQRELSAQRRPRWAAMAQYTALRASWLEGERSPAVHQLARSTAAALEDAGWALAAMDAQLIACRVALELGDVRAAELALGETGRARLRGPVELRARAWHAEALLRLAHGNRRGADAALRAGMRALERHRATLGSTELRAHVAGYAGELATLGLRLAFDARAPWRVLGWAERWRAGSLHLRPVRPPEDEELTAALAALRGTVAELDAAALQGRDTRPLLREQARLEAVVQHRTRLARGDGALATAVAPDALGEALGEAALVEMVSLDGRIEAVVVAGGRARLRTLAPQRTVLDELEGLRFSLRRMSRGNASSRAREAAEAAAAHAAQQLDVLLLGPVRALVGDRPLVLVPTGPLHALPWSALPTCRGREVAVAPSAQLWLRARGSGEALARAPEVALVGSTELPHASAEVQALHRSYPRSRLLLGADATVQAVTAALDGADVAHIACHGQFRADNPLFSCMRLADGPLTVYDLERLQRAPRLLLLSACDAGLTAVEPGDELMGLSAALFSLGARALIASVVPVPDAGTRALMLALHDRLRRGERPALALARARSGLGSEAAAAAAGFVCFGAG